jgi:hypothetical protein
MKTYPSIEHAIKSNLEIFAFDKLDGSNIRAEWNKKRGFYKFGTRQFLLDRNHPILGESVDLIIDKYGKQLDQIFNEQKYQSAIAFFEFHGPNSFAGYHQKEQHDVTLFDVAPYKKGILMPADFLKLFGGLDHAKLLYRGACTPEFIQKVRLGTLDSMTFEGVICKAPNGKTPMPLMFKIKNRAWVEKLRTICKNEEQFNLLV